MFKLFNNKLYNQYYPLKTEEDKNNFLNSNYTKIRKMIDDIGCIARNELYAIEHDYVKKMKPTVSFFGSPKYRNIAHNEYIVHKMQTDRRIKNIEKKFQDLDPLAYKIAYHEHENITVDELNYLLRLINTRKHYNLGIILVLVILIIVCGGFLCR